MQPDIFDALSDIIRERAADQTNERSYVRSLLFHEKGIDKSLEKVGEEAVEYVLAVKNGEPDRIISEAADLIFHLMVSLRAADIDFEAVIEELAKRRTEMSRSR
ncbi:MAG: phosphoribosyl-ATP diphosphatase [Methanocalculus sp. MSAO_Arc1]|uniref:phosphoribosyl-ATP diphosphatase n=1 Tax=Methanocalculus TaxID=71151 RepID=UPI000FF509DB|nr:MULTISPECIES: phosphoribosyl-ATP diphosphatase [unclassified Methanocalculus]MCP1662303.1 phosphoribosyl-ATP pyrophosphohydrolase [Methanocalculus sp. AMF5]RQD80935.1 MAG: phosphoribosyl-ATP diphosphatase [Methanocalculus sp. MSAO_Arc1]